MEDLLESLRSNFEGREEIHRLLLDAPKYGNDDDYADRFVKDWYEILWEEHQRGRPYQNKTVVSRPEAFSVTVHFSRGHLTGALPCGRKARLPLTDASVSPMPGTDRNGPTALINSVAKVLDTIKWGSSHLNMKFLPFSFETKDKIKHFLTLLKVYMDLGGGHVQFNCVSNKTLKDAQVHPEKHRDLVIRVAGFSAYFIYLDKEVQEEIIKRTEIGI
jgi:pyruvate-formate lyase